MNTSYLAHYKGINGVAITLRKPWFFTGPHYPQLAPSLDLLTRFQKKTITEAEYEQEYRRDILSSLDPQKVYDDLKDKVILCYEKPPKFCHRHIVAVWIKEKLNIEVIEI
jgi:uncharacterized protein (DUF488 family)